MSTPPGWRHRHYDTLASTSDLCATLAAAGEPGHLAISAARQTHARGSRGRAWTTSPGALAVSVLLRPAGPASDAGHWALLAAVALRSALDEPAITCKWPNDLLLGGRKLAGVLIDTAIRQPAPNPLVAGPVEGCGPMLSGIPRANGPVLDWLVIGFGANLRAAPDGAASLPRDTAIVTAALLAQIDAWDGLRLREGWSAIRQAWVAAGPALGTHMQAGAIAGTYQGLSDTGALLLQTGGRVHAITTGDVLYAQ